MNHDQCRERLSPYLDGELSSADSVLVSEHVAACAACRLLHDQMKGISRIVRSLDRESMPASLRETLARTAGLGLVRPAAARAARYPWSLASLASAALVVIIVVVVRRADWRQPAPILAPAPHAHELTAETHKQDLTKDEEAPVPTGSSDSLERLDDTAEKRSRQRDDAAAPPSRPPAESSGPKAARPAEQPGSEPGGAAKEEKVAALGEAESAGSIEPDAVFSAPAALAAPPASPRPAAAPVPQPGRFRTELRLDDPGRPALGPLVPILGSRLEAEADLRKEPALEDEAGRSSALSLKSAGANAARAGALTSPSPAPLTISHASGSLTPTLARILFERTGPEVRLIFLVKLNGEGRPVSAEMLGVRTASPEVIRAVTSLLLGSVLAPHESADPSTVVLEVVLPASK